METTLAELERTDRLGEADAARVQMVRSMADALDVRPHDAQMWRQYREALEGLIGDGNKAEVASLLEELRTPVRDGETT